MRSISARLNFRVPAAALAAVLSIAVAAPAEAQQPKPPATGAAKPPPPKKKGPPMSEAQKKDAAKKNFKEAEAKFDKGDYAGALVLYQEADDLIPGASPKYKMAVSLDKMNKTKEAVEAYQKFLDANPDPEKFKDKIADAKGRQEALKKTPGKVKVALSPDAAPPGLKLEIDGTPATPGPGNELSIPPGKHKITAKATGYDPSTQDVDVAFAETKEVTLTLKKSTTPAPVAVVTPPPAPTTTAAAPVTPAPKPPPPPAEPRSNVPAYVTLGLAGAGAIVGTIFGIQALSAKSDYEAEPTQEKFDDAERSALLADMSYGVALTFGVTGIVLLLSNDSPEPAKAVVTKPTKVAKPFITPYVGPKGGGASATLRF